MGNKVVDSVLEKEPNTDDPQTHVNTNATFQSTAESTASPHVFDTPPPHFLTDTLPSGLATESATMNSLLFHQTTQMDHFSTLSAPELPGGSKDAPSDEYNVDISFPDEEGVPHALKDALSCLRVSYDLTSQIPLTLFNSVDIAALKDPSAFTEGPTWLCVELNSTYICYSTKTHIRVFPLSNTQIETLGIPIKSKIVNLSLNKERDNHLLACSANGNVSLYKIAPTNWEAFFTLEFTTCPCRRVLWHSTESLIFFTVHLDMIIAWNVAALKRMFDSNWGGMVRSLKVNEELIQNYGFCIVFPEDPYEVLYDDEDKKSRSLRGIAFWPLSNFVVMAFDHSLLTIWSLKAGSTTAMSGRFVAEWVLQDQWGCVDIASINVLSGLVQPPRQQRQYLVVGSHDNYRLKFYNLADIKRCMYSGDRVNCIQRIQWASPKASLDFLVDAISAKMHLPRVVVDPQHSFVYWQFPMAKERGITTLCVLESASSTDAPTCMGDVAASSLAVSSVRIVRLPEGLYYFPIFVTTPSRLLISVSMGPTENTTATTNVEATEKRVALRFSYSPLSKVLKWEGCVVGHTREATRQETPPFEKDAVLVPPPAANTHGDTHSVVMPPFQTSLLVDTKGVSQTPTPLPLPQEGHVLLQALHAPMMKANVTPPTLHTATLNTVNGTASITKSSASLLSLLTVNGKASAASTAPPMAHTEEPSSKVREGLLHTVVVPIKDTVSEGGHPATLYSVTPPQTEDEAPSRLILGAAPHPFTDPNKTDPDPMAATSPLNKPEPFSILEAEGIHYWEPMVEPRVPPTALLEAWVQQRHPVPSPLNPFSPELIPLTTLVTSSKASAADLVDLQDSKAVHEEPGLKATFEATDLITEVSPPSQSAKPSGEALMAEKEVVPSSTTQVLEASPRNSASKSAGKKGDSTAYPSPKSGPTTVDALSLSPTVEAIGKKQKARDRRLRKVVAGASSDPSSLLTDSVLDSKWEGGTPSSSVLPVFPTASDSLPPKTNGWMSSDSASNVIIEKKPNTAATVSICSTDWATKSASTKAKAIEKNPKVSKKEAPVGTLVAAKPLLEMPTEIPLKKGMLGEPEVSRNAIYKLPSEEAKAPQKPTPQTESLQEIAQTVVKNVTKEVKAVTERLLYSNRYLILKEVEHLVSSTKHSIVDVSKEYSAVAPQLKDLQTAVKSLESLSLEASKNVSPDAINAAVTTSLRNTNEELFATGMKHLSDVLTHSLLDTEKLLLKRFEGSFSFMQTNANKHFERSESEFAALQEKLHQMIPDVITAEIRSQFMSCVVPAMRETLGVGFQSVQESVKVFCSAQSNSTIELHKVLISEFIEERKLIKEEFDQFKDSLSKQTHHLTHAVENLLSKLEGVVASVEALEKRLVEKPVIERLELDGIPPEDGIKSRSSSLGNRETDQQKINELLQKKDYVNALHFALSAEWRNETVGQYVAKLCGKISSSLILEHAEIIDPLLCLAISKNLLSAMLNGKTKYAAEEIRGFLEWIKNCLIATEWSQMRSKNTAIVDALSEMKADVHALAEMLSASLMHPHRLIIIDQLECVKRQITMILKRYKTAVH